VSIAVQVILVGPAACLGGTVVSKNAYLCRPPNHVPRRPQAFTPGKAI